MSLPEDNCEFWNKMEAVDVGTGKILSEIGPHLTPYGPPTFPAIKFNNGGYSVNNTQYAEVVDPMVNKDAFAIEMYIYTSFSVLNGVTSDSAVRPIFWFYTDTGNRFHLNFYGWVFLGMEFVLDGGNAGFYMTTDITWSATTPTHLLSVINKSGIGSSGDTYRFYINGNKVFNSVSAIPTVTSQSGWNFRILKDQWSGWDYSLTGGLDNIKIYNNPTEELITAILANKDTEGWPAAEISRPKLFNYPFNKPYNEPIRGIMQ